MIVDGQEIAIKIINDQDYLSLTEMAKRREGQRPDNLIRSWIKNSSTIQFLEAWEKIHNPNFNSSQMVGIKAELFEEREITPKQFIQRTNAIGIQSKAGRYGGTFAHIDLAMEFAMWLEPAFKVFLIKDYQRLKLHEQQRIAEGWDIARFLTKISYSTKTAAIDQNIVPRLNPKDKPFAYANEADMINLIVFGKTARQWRQDNPEAKGNIRDHAGLIELLLIDRLDTVNTRLIKEGAGQENRVEALQKFARFLIDQLTQDPRLTGGSQELLRG